MRSPSWAVKEGVKGSKLVSERGDDELDEIRNQSDLVERDLGSQLGVDGQLDVLVSGLGDSQRGLEGFSEAEGLEIFDVVLERRPDGLEGFAVGFVGLGLVVGEKTSGILGLEVLEDSLAEVAGVGHENVVDDGLEVGPLEIGVHSLRADIEQVESPEIDRDFCGFNIRSEDSGSASL